MLEFIGQTELEGLNDDQSIANIQQILKEIGVEGRPSLAQCKIIKRRRKFMAGFNGIDISKIIGNRSTNIRIERVNFKH